MANIRNSSEMADTEARQAARSRWAGEVSMDPTWNEPWTSADTRFSGYETASGQTPAIQSGMNSGMVMSNGMTMGQNGMTGGMSGMNGSMNGGASMGSGMSMGQNGMTGGMGGTLDMQHNLPDEVIESPTSVNEAYLGSLKATLVRNKGNYIVGSFLIGTQNIVSWEGILYDVGNDFVTIYQPGRDRYIVCDIYSLKYMEFFDTQRREMCAQMLRQNDWQNNG